MAENNIHIVNRLIYQVGRLSTVDALRLLVREFPGQVTFSTSFSYEDQVITHDILTNQIPVKIFTLDTGRLFAQTYSVWESTLERYKASITAYYPNEQLLQEFIEEKGPNAFYKSVENRKGCCYIRKVEPLQRALAGNKVWVTGLRAEHSANRQGLQPLEWDEQNQVIKFHPILSWGTNAVTNYVREHHIPYNPLHNEGFVSIGCAPCTRAIKRGEDFRAGRWWWEDADKKECGLHVSTKEATISS